MYILFLEILDHWFHHNAFRCASVESQKPNLHTNDALTGSNYINIYISLLTKTIIIADDYLQIIRNLYKYRSESIQCHRFGGYRHYHYLRPCISLLKIGCRLLPTATGATFLKIDQWSLPIYSCTHFYCVVLHSSQSFTIAQRRDNKTEQKKYGARKCISST